MVCETARRMPQPNGQLEEGFNQPAKLADRVIAPGDGPAEPGEYNPKTGPSHEVCDRWMEDG